MKRRLAMLCGILAASLLVVAIPVFSSVVSPSGTEFTLKYEANPYDVPPTYKIDPYTGKQVVDKTGYHVKNESIVITIKNPDFVSSVNGTNYYLAYNVREKGHFETEWNKVYLTTECTLSKYNSEEFPKASNSTYTVLSISAQKYPSEARVDVQVQAIVGYASQVYVLEYMPDHPLAPPIGGHYEEGVTFDTAGDWGKIQTITGKVPAPEIFFSSPQDKTYAEDSVNLNFTVSKETSWMGYSLDGQANVTLKETTLNLAKLTNGAHTLTIYANGTYPDTETSKTINFTINKEPDQLNIILTGVLILVPVATAIGLLLYFRKRKQSSNTRIMNQQYTPSNGQTTVFHSIWNITCSGFVGV